MPKVKRTKKGFSVVRKTDGKQIGYVSGHGKKARSQAQRISKKHSSGKKKSRRRKR